MTTTTSGPLNEAQLMLLKLFSRPMSESETEELRKVIIGFYQKKLVDAVEGVIEEKGITDEDFDQILQRQYRTKRS